jgi:hypothetical protein
MSDKDIEEYKQRISELENKLKKYTNPDRHKRYYENNKELVKDKAKIYMDKIKTEDPDKLKKWRHTAYINKKNKLEGK